MANKWNLSQLYQGIVAHSHHCMVVLDCEANIKAYNDAFKQWLELITGLRTGSFMDRKFLAVFPDDVRGSFALVIETLDTGKQFSGVVRQLPINDSYLNYTVDTQLVVDDEGGTHGVIAVIRNVSEELDKEQKLLLVEKHAVLGRLAAGIAHEIRNPLTAASGFIQLLLKNEEQHLAMRELSYLEFIHHELKRINHLVNEFMLLAKPKVSDKKNVNISMLIHDVIDFMEGQAILSNVHLEKHFYHSVLIIRLDEERIKQALINVIRNGIEAMPDGGVLDIFVHDLGELVQIEIADQGIGIPSDQIDKIFDLFYTTKEDGTGIGLTGVHQIIHDHAGTISVSSESGKGTSFRIQLPKA